MYVWFFISVRVYEYRMYRMKCPNSFLPPCSLHTYALTHALTHARTHAHAHAYVGVDDSLLVLPLHTALPHSLQMRVFSTAYELYMKRAGVSHATCNNQKKHALHNLAAKARKVVLCTGMAECGVTIPGVRHVIDSGFYEMVYADTRTGMDVRTVAPVTKGSMVQRTGRAGRTQPGKCYRLYPESLVHSTHTPTAASAVPVTDTDMQDIMLSHNIPEMQRCDLTATVLRLKSLSIDDVLHFDFLSPPSTHGISAALELLYGLGAITADGALTDMGTRMSELPVTPRLARCLLASIKEGCVDDMLSVAAMCSVAYPFLSSRHNISSSASNSSTRHERQQEQLSQISMFAHLDGDHCSLLNIYKTFTTDGATIGRPHWCKEHGLSLHILNAAMEIRHELCNVMRTFVKEDLELALQEQERRNDEQEQECEEEGTGEDGEDAYGRSTGKYKRPFRVSSSSPSSSSASATSNLPSMGGCGDDLTPIRRSLIPGYYTNIAKLTPAGTYVTCYGGIAVVPHAQSVSGRYSAPPEWVVYQEAYDGEVCMYVCTRVSMDVHVSHTLCRALGLCLRQP